MCAYDSRIDLILNRFLYFCFLIIWTRFTQQKTRHVSQPHSIRNPAWKIKMSIFWFKACLSVFRINWIHSLSCHGILWDKFPVRRSLPVCGCCLNYNHWTGAPRLHTATTGAMRQCARLLHEESHVVACWHHELTEFAMCLHLCVIDVWLFDCMLACSSLLAQVCNLHTFIDWRLAHEVFRFG